MLVTTPRVVPVLGVSSLEQLDEAMDALDLELDEKTMAELDS